MKNNLGTAIRNARDALAMTRRELAEKVGVRASHIAYIENAQRGPSLPLLRRIADALGLDRRELLFLSHPETRILVGSLGGEARKGSHNAWRKFVSNQALLRRHNVTRAELRVLRQVSLLRDISHVSHFVFILNSIRQAGIPET